ECEMDSSGVLQGTPTTGDPQLVVRLADGPVPAGFWRFSLDLMSAPGAMAKLYPDYGSGVAEATSQLLSDCSGSDTKSAVLYFPEQVVALRLDPHEDLLPFSAGSALLERLDPRRALWLRARDLFSEA